MRDHLVWDGIVIPGSRADEIVSGGFLRFPANITEDGVLKHEPRITVAELKRWRKFYQAERDR